MGIPLLTAVEDWCCPNCAYAEQTRGLPPNAARFHTCPGLHMLSAPLVRAGIACKVEAEERGDYLGSEIQAHGDDGKPYMAVRTTRADGDDLAVNAGMATARQGDLPMSEQEEIPAVVVQAQAATASSSVSPGPAEDED